MKTTPEWKTLYCADCRVLLLGESCRGRHCRPNDAMFGVEFPAGYRTIRFDNGTTHARPLCSRCYQPSSGGRQ